jgi:hypothetical protein
VRAIEGGLLAGVVVAGCLLRLAHFVTPNLWWDELVHVRTADLPALSRVFSEVRQGIPPGSGNAGAVPLDYVLLHAHPSLVRRRSLGSGADLTAGC